MFTPSKTKKILLKFFIVLFILVQGFSFLLIPTSVKAVVGAPDVVALNTSKWTWEKIQKALTSAALGSLLHASSYFMRKMAYDGATYIASGGKGQGALAFKDGAGAYFENLAKDASADLINEFGKPFGLNLCSTPDLQLQVFMQIGLHSLYWDSEGPGAGPSPSCNWQQMSKAWSSEAFEEKYGPGGSKFISESFSNALRFEDSDFGIALGAKAKIDRNTVSKILGATQDRIEGQGFKPVTELISGKIKSPADVVREESKVISSKQQGEMTSSQLAGVYGSGFLQVIPMAASVFLNTLVGEGLKNARDELLNLGKKKGGDSAFEALSYESSGFQSSRKKAESVFSDLLTVAITQVNSYAQLEEFSSCPGYPIKPGLNNCVMDSGLRQALEESSLGEPLTIQQALDKKYLVGSWPLYSPDRIADNLDKNCYQKAFCYPNIQKLRRARILPLGFEIAATLADPDDPEAMWTLDQVVKGFYDCAEVELEDGTFEIVEDLVNHPYCHLIDPNWILKTPEARCNAQVYASNLLDDNKTGIRSQECVDVQSCIKENEDGTCDFFGYCTKEKNVWRFNADRCEPQYNTCTTFVSSEGGIDSYLARTVDYGNCSYDSVGCRSYSTEKNGDPLATSTTWVASSNFVNKSFENLGRNQTVFFNQNIENYTDNCSESVVGCSEFYSGSDDDYEKDYNDLVYLQKAPDYLGCYDVDLSDCPVGDDPITSCEFIKNQCWGTCVGIPPNYTCISQCNVDYDSCLASQQNNDCVNADIDWPQTKADLTILEDRSEACSEYAQVCLPTEVGCDAYTPVAGPNPIKIPGIIGSNECPEVCSGYETFRQDSTSFEPEEFPLYFIPDEAIECNSSFKGCDEFTNIDELARGGEGLEYYSDIKYCERPADDNEKVFYSWEGSKSEGYVLKLHKLRPVKESEEEYLASLVAVDLFLGTESVADVFPKGSPAYASERVADLNSNYHYCNADAYNNLLNDLEGDKASSDCRALYDKSGKIYYRILAHTVTVSDECHPLRKTNSVLLVDSVITSSATCLEKNGVWGNLPDVEPAQDGCQRCFAGGVYENGACIYWAMSGANESIACPATANGCRAYTGNSANNFEQVFLLDFDIFGDDDAMAEAKAGWSPSSSVAISPESIQVGLESLQIKNKNVHYEFDSPEFAIGDIFELSFWARGENQNIAVYFEQAGQTKKYYFTYNKLSNEETKVGITSDWKQYSLGPITLSDVTANTMKLVFESDKASNILYFIDNIQLKRVTDKYYLIKDSWKKDYGSDGVIRDVPEVCDETPADPYPGVALGCREYREGSTGDSVYAIGFDSMCREEAVGCRALFPTNNNSQSNVEAYNLWCEDGENGGDDKKCELLFEPGEDQDVKTLGSCVVPTGEDGCFIAGPINSDNSNYIDSISDQVTNAVIVTSTIIIPADSDTPIFLTDRSDFRCEEKNKGCMEIALEEKNNPNADQEGAGAFSYSELYALNDPDNYDEILCRSDLVGCGEYTADNEKYFFKDPNIMGSSFCEYKDKVEDEGGTTYSGWFLRDYGTCGDSTDLCKTDDDCGEDVLCAGQGTIPCYQDYLLAGGEYGLWSNNSEKYKGLVGVCSESDNGCREFIDPQDTSSLYPDGQAYHLIYNQKLIDPVSECEGQASLQEGCVLFNKTDYPNLLYDAFATYEASEDKNFEGVSLVSDPTGIDNDSNILLKVVRDRECSEWLACQGYVEVADTQIEGDKRNVCYAVQSCEGGTALNCSSPVKDSDDKDKILDIDSYIKREISWQEGREFSGYSLFNQYQIGDLDYVRVKKTNSNSLEEDEVFIGFVDNNYNDGCVGPGVGNPCGADLLGICHNQKCVYPATGGTFLNPTNFYEDLYDQDCRGYPESDSPFVDDGSNSIVESWQGMRPLYSNSSYVNANICQLGEDCSCDYLRIGYGEHGRVTEDRFFELDGKIRSNYINADAEPQGLIKEIKIDNLKIIQGGEDDGEYCGGKLDLCPTSADTTTAISIVKKNRRIGWKGYCLERDYSHHINGRIDNADDAFACLTWMPLDYVPGAFDIYNADESIGYVPPSVDGVTGGKAYCTEMIGWQNMELFSSSQDDNIYKFDCDFTTINYDYLHGALQQNYCRTYIWNNNGGLTNSQFHALLTLGTGSLQPYNVDEPDIIDTEKTFTPTHYDLKSFQEMAWAFINTIAGENVEEEILHHDGLSLPPPSEISQVQLDFFDISSITWQQFNFSNDWNLPFYLFDFNYYSPGSHFISRVDTSMNSPVDVYGDTVTLSDGQWSSLINDANLDELNKRTIGFMATQGFSGKMMAPLLPDLTKNGMDWVTDYASDETRKQETLGKSGGGSKSLFEYYDSGVIRHKPNKIESFITKDMVQGVSFVPLWVVEESTDDNVQGVQIPMMGLPLAIDFNADYESVNGNPDNITKEDLGHSSQSNSDDFGKYWILESEHNMDPFYGEDLEGYILIWTALDPFSGVAQVSKGTEVYENYNIPNWDNRTQNPFKVNMNEQYVGISHLKGNNIIALEVLFEKNTGKFAGYRSRSISTFGGESEVGYSMAVVFTLQPMCVEAVEVYDDAPDDNSFVTNKAWTNRLWEESGYDYLYIKDLDDNDGYGYDNFIIRDIPALPFGSINSDFNERWFTVLRISELSDTPHAGRPTLCLDRFYFEDEEYSDLKIRSKCKTKKDPFVSSEFIGSLDHFYPISNYDGQTSLGSDILNTSDLGANGFDNDDSILAKTTIQDLFSKVFNVHSKVEIKNGTVLNQIFLNKMNDNINVTATSTYKDVAFDQGTPPVIFYPAEEFKLTWGNYQDKFAINGVGSVDNKLYGKGN
ncbi:MAG: hypothetical protein ABIJ23_02640, partial [Candidatus Magasanikbacteria bacterium]